MKNLSIRKPIVYSFYFFFFMTFSNTLFAVTADEVTDKMVKEQIKAYIRTIINKQEADGSISCGYQGVRGMGATALNVLALALAGVKENSPVLTKATLFLRKNFPGRSKRTDTYSIGLYAMAFQAVNSKKYKREITKAVNWLISKQDFKTGTWSYTGGGGGDNSIAQYAALGLKAGKEAGIKIPQRVLDRLQEHFRKMQCADGGWAYSGNKNSTPSMTTAGLSSLHITGVSLETSLELKKGPKFIGEYKTDPTIKRGVKHIGEIFRKGEIRDSYTIYGVERVGIFFDQRRLGGVDWFAQGTAMILNKEIRYGKITEAYNLLFLAKGDLPILINKIVWGAGQEWNYRHNDVRNMVSLLSKTFNKKMDWQENYLEIKSGKLGQAPMLYLSGLDNFTVSDNELNALKSFIDEGGTVLISPYLKSKSFTKEILKAIQKIFPGSSFDTVPREHELRRMYYDLSAKNIPLRVLKNNCSLKKVFLLQKDFSLNYEKGRPSTEIHMTLANLARFSLGEKPLVGKMARVALKKTELEKALEKIDYSKEKGSSNGGLNISTILLNGEEKTDLTAMNNLLGFFRKALKIPTPKEAKFTTLTSTNLMTNPVLYMTGNKKFELTPEELKNLRKYLDNGGFLFADSACSCGAFTQSFTKMVNRLYPAEKFELIPKTSPIFIEPYQLKIKFTKALKNIANEKTLFLKGIRRNKRFVIAYSPYDFNSAMANKLDENSKGIKSPSAFLLVSNIISYALGY